MICKNCGKWIEWYTPSGWKHFSSFKPECENSDNKAECIDLACKECGHNMRYNIAQEYFICDNVKCINYNINLDMVKLFKDKNIINEIIINIFKQKYGDIVSLLISDFINKVITDSYNMGYEVGEYMYEV